ncbi:MAG: glycoside hydrolase family 18 protein [Terriglobales bacterium]
MRSVRSLVICSGFLILVSSVTPLFAGAQKPSTKPEVIAYVFKRDLVIQPGEIAVEKLTRINYAFALIQNGEMVNGYANDDRNLAVLVALKRHNPSLKVFISVGGWLGSGNFSDMALTKKTRRVFIESAVKFIERNQLDGLDIDWEYPGLVGAGNRFRPEDKQNFTLLCKELRRRFDKEEKRLHRRLFVTVAAGTASSFLEHTDMREVQKYVDTINLMAYDYYEPTDSAITGHHAPLFTNASDPKKISADRSVREFEEAGVPASKMVLGVPFYGHSWGDVDDVDHGLFRPGKPVPNAFTHYGDILSTMLNHGFVRYWDAAASAPYLYAADKKIFVSYEDPESLALKCKYVLDHKLRGVMFWEYGADPTGALLDAIDAGLWNAPAGAVAGK